MKGRNPDLAHKECFKIAAENWKTHKDNPKSKKDDTATPPVKKQKKDTKKAAGDEAEPEKKPAEHVGPNGGDRGNPPGSSKKKNRSKKKSKTPAASPAEKETLHDPVGMGEDPKSRGLVSI